MNLKHRILVLSSAVVAVMVVRAQEAGDTPAGGPPKIDRTEIIRKFDQNGDGVIDDAERQAARKALATSRPRATGTGEAPAAAKSERLRRFDRNGDGVIDDQERQGIRDELAKTRPPGGTNLAAQRPPIDREALVKEFDKDGNGALNDTERKAAMQAMRERLQRATGTNAPARPARAEVLRRFDANGDGVLDDAERRKAQATRPEAGTPSTP